MARLCDLIGDLDAISLAVWLSAVATLPFFGKQRPRQLSAQICQDVDSVASLSTGVNGGMHDQLLHVGFDLRLLSFQLSW